MIRQVTLNKANRLKDKSVSMQFITSLEQSPDEFMELDKLLDKQGVIYFSETAISDEQKKEIDNVNVKPLEGKSASQRLRAVMYVLFQQDGGTYDNFKDFYENRMELIIQQIKNKLD